MKGIATIQVDVDSFQDVWADSASRSNLTTRGATIYQSAVLRFAELFERYGIKATFFVVGRDTLERENLPVLHSLLERGHELANHTMHHQTRPAFCSLDHQAQAREVKDGHQAIEDATGLTPVGFKAPAYSMQGPRLMDTLEELGYWYDSSICPVIASRLVTIAQHLLTRQSRPSGHWGDPLHGLAPLKPYHPAQGAAWRRGDRRLVEVPVSTIPGFRLPFHASVMFLLGPWVSRAGLELSRALGGYLNYQFHAFDLADPEEVPAGLLKLRPGSRRPLSDKLRLVEEMLSRIHQGFSVMPTRDLVKSLPS